MRPLFQRDYFAFPFSARFFKNSCAGSLVKARRKKAFASSSGMVISSGTRLSMKPPRLQSLWFLALRSSTDSFCLMIFSRFSNCRIFFLFSSISAVNSSRFFSLGFVLGGHSFLPVGIEKGQSISSAVLLIRVFGLLRSAQ